MSTPFQPLPCGGDASACCSASLATTGLCLGDGTPIAVVTTTPCAECGEAAGAPAAAGWINLLTGAFAAGNPPAGSEPCLNQQQQFQVGQWCDLDAAGEVIAPVLVEYEYSDTGALIGIRTLTPGGDPYVVAGTLGICPGAVDDVEYLILCDVLGDGTSVPFLRALTPNGDGTSTADDTTLDGTAPYAPAGTVSACAGPCRTTFSEILCEASGLQTYASIATNRATDRVRVAAPGPTLGDLNLSPLFGGGSVTSAVPALPSVAQVQYYGAGNIVLPAGEPCGPPTDVQITMSARFTNNGPGTGQATSVLFSLLDGTTILANSGVAGGNPGQSFPRTVTATVPLSALMSGQITMGLYVEATQNNHRESWTIDQWSLQVQSTEAIAGCGGTEFRRTFVQDCESGDIVAQVDTTLAGAPYTVAGAVSSCPTEEAATGTDVETWPLCVIDADGVVLQHIRAEQIYDAAGFAVGAPRLVDAVTGGAITLPGGAHIGVCPGECCDTGQTVLLCDVEIGISTPFLRRLTYAPGADVATVVDTALDGVTPYVPAGDVSVCGSATSGNPLISSTVIAHDGVGATTGIVPSGARSITLTVLSGTVDVVIGAEPPVTLPPGSWSWSVDRGGPGGERLADVFEFIAVNGDVFTVHTTRELL